MSDPRETLAPALRVSIERNTQALTRALSSILPAAVEALAQPSRRLTQPAPGRPAADDLRTAMNEEGDR